MHYNTLRCCSDNLLINIMILLNYTLNQHCHPTILHQLISLCLHCFIGDIEMWCAFISLFYELLPARYNIHQKVHQFSSILFLWIEEVQSIWNIYSAMFYTRLFSHERQKTIKFNHKTFFCVCQTFERSSILTENAYRGQLWY